MPVLFLLMRGIRRHYDRVSAELAVGADEHPDAALLPSRVHAIVLVSKIHKPTLRALAYARVGRPDVLEAVTVNVDLDETRALTDEWDRRNLPVPLKVLDSPYREITRPIVDYVKNIRRASPRDVVTVYIPEYIVGRWWEQLLHNQSALRLKGRLLFTPGVMVTSVPWQLASSDVALRKDNRAAPGDVRRGEVVATRRESKTIDVAMKLRIFTEPQQGASYEQQLRVARAGEALGFDAFFRSDHYLTPDSDGLPGPTDSWITLGGLARETSRIRLGTLVTPVTFRSPGVLAISVAQVDQMSGGRVELGLGAGWFAEEHAAYALPFPSIQSASPCSRSNSRSSPASGDASRRTVRLHRGALQGRELAGPAEAGPAAAPTGGHGRQRAAALGPARGGIRRRVQRGVCHAG